MEVKAFERLTDPTDSEFLVGEESLSKRLRNIADAIEQLEDLGFEVSIRPKTNRIVSSRPRMG